MLKFRFVLILVIGLCMNIFSQSKVEGNPAGDASSSSVIINKMSPDRPFTFELYQNYPNPFNPNTRIKFDVPVRSKINISVYDMKGNTVKQLVSGKLNAGTYAVEWFADEIPAGIYVYEMRSGIINISRKTILAK